MGLQKPGSIAVGADRLHRGGIAIAGVGIRVDSKPSLELRSCSPLYQPFLRAIFTLRQSQRIDVRLRFVKFPDLGRKKRVFDTQESWAMFQDEAYCWVRYQPEKQTTPFWIARFDRQARHVSIFLSPAAPAGSGLGGKIDHPIHYPLDQLLLMYYFARRQGILMHAAGTVQGGKAYLFAGASGAGKSTLSELLVKAKIGKVLSDERMIVRQIAGRMIAFGTPWAGTAGIARAGNAPLAAIFFLRHGKSNRCEKLTAAAAADRLLPLASVPWYDPDTAAPIIAFAKCIMAKVPAYEMSFTPDRSATDFFRKIIKKAS